MEGAAISWPLMSPKAYEPDGLEGLGEEGDVQALGDELGAELVDQPGVVPAS